MSELVFDFDARRGSLRENARGVFGVPNYPYEFVRMEKGYAIKDGATFNKGIEFGEVGDYEFGTQPFTIIVAFEDLRNSTLKVVRPFYTSDGSNDGVGLWFYSHYGLSFRIWNSGDYVSVSGYYLTSPPPTKLQLYRIDVDSHITIRSYDKDGNLFITEQVTNTLWGRNIIQGEKLHFSEVFDFYLLRSMAYKNGLVPDNKFNDILSDFVNSHPTGKPIQYHNFTFPTKPAIVSKDGLVFKLPPQITGNKVVNAVAGGEDIVGTVTQVDQAVDGLVSRGTGSKIDFGEDILNTATEWTVQWVMDGYEKTSAFDIFLGDINVKLVSLSYGSYLAFKDLSGTYVKFTELPTSEMENKLSIITLRSNGTKIYAYLNGKLKGYITPATTGLRISRIIQGWETTQFTPKLKLIDLEVYSKALSESEIKEYHNQYLSKSIIVEDFSQYPVGKAPFNWYVSSGAFTIAEDSDGKYLSCTTSGVIQLRGVNLNATGHGYIKTLTGDLSGEGETVDDSADLSWNNNILSVSMSAGDKLYELVITYGEEAG